MPADRFIHPRLGHSAKVSSLTDLQYRVWTVYLVASDDYGVMRASAVTLQAADDSLMDRPQKLVQAALERLIEVGLLAAFEDQGRRYVCQLNWNDWQRVDYPRETINPRPPDETIEQATEATKRLFSVWNARSKTPKADRALENNSGMDRESSEKDPDLARAHVRETAKAKANGCRPTDARADFDTFWDAYPRKIGKDAAKKAWAKKHPPLGDVLSALERQCQSEQWTRDGGQFIPHPTTWLNQGRWQDEGDSAPAPAERWWEECARLGHSPRCANLQWHQVQMAKQGAA